ncbi:hypothetical protein Tco_1465053, partial [Tanacetum coccineum]
MQKESVSKQGRKFAKAEPIVHKDPAFDELNDDAFDYIETEDAQDMGRTRYVVHEEKESAEKEVSTKDALNTAQPKVSTDKKEVSTDRPDEGTDKQKVSTDKEEVSTDKPDEASSKDKGKKKIEEDESDIESEDINESKKKFKMLAHDEEIARKVQEDWEAEEEVKKLAEEEATN